MRCALLVLLLALCALAAQARITRVQQTINQAAATTGGYTDDDALKLISCCVSKTLECEPGYCDAQKASQAALLDSISKEVTAEVTDTAEPPTAEDLAKFHNMADTHKTLPPTTVPIPMPSSFLETDAEAQAQAEAEAQFQAQAGNPVVRAALWDKGTVTYKNRAATVGNCGAPNLATKVVLSQVMDEFHKRTCVRFKSDPAGLVEIGTSTAGKGSWAGAVGNTARELCIDPSLRMQHLNHYTLIHEMGHLLGMWHTNQRSDSATYVTKDLNALWTAAKGWCNEPTATTWTTCLSGWYYQYYPHPSVVMTDTQVPYSYKSVMHYPFGAGMAAVPAKYATAKAANGNKDILPGTYGLTDEDAAAINEMYGCIKVNVQRKSGGAPGATKAIWLHPQQDMDVIKHSIEEHLGTDETRVVLKKGGNPLAGANLAAAGVVNNDNLVAEV